MREDDAGARPLLHVSDLARLLRREPRAARAWNSRSAAGRGRDADSGATARGRPNDDALDHGMLRQRRGSHHVRRRRDDGAALGQDRAARHRLRARGARYLTRSSMREILKLQPVVKPGGMSVDEVYYLFPRCCCRAPLCEKGHQAVGREQQMLAIARMLRPPALSCLLASTSDEELRTHVIVQQIGAIIGELKRKGFTILLVEQNFHLPSASPTGTTSSSTARAWRCSATSIRLQHEDAAGLSRRYLNNPPGVSSRPQHEGETMMKRMLSAALLLTLALHRRRGARRADRGQDRCHSTTSRPYIRT